MHKRHKSRDLQPLAPLDVNQRYTIEEAARYLRKSRSSIFGEIRAGTIETILEGKRRYIPGVVIAKRSTLPAVAA